jgi:putative redox protein
MEKPPVHANLIWEGDLRFRASSGNVEAILDGDSAAGASPVQALAFALAGCMAIDVVDILRKGRHQITSLSTKVVAFRADTTPRRFIRAELRFEIRGNPPAPAVERAIQLSRDRYCSVWHSMRQDIELTTTFELES